MEDNTFKSYQNLSVKVLKALPDENNSIVENRQIADPLQVVPDENGFDSSERIDLKNSVLTRIMIGCDKV